MSNEVFTDGYVLRMSNEVFKDGYVRRVWARDVTFTPRIVFDGKGVDMWYYDVVRFPFEPGYHVVRYEDTYDVNNSPDITVLSSHKTLAEALSICKVLLANGGIKYE